MKKWFYLFLSIMFVFAACKKNGEEITEEENEQVYECLPKQKNYIDYEDSTYTNVTTYNYDGNAISSKTKSFASGNIYTYKYIYVNKEKGLLDVINISKEGSTIAKLEYDIQNDLIASYKLLVKSIDNDWLTAWEVYPTYDNNNKVTSLHILDYDLWDEDDDGQREPTDETGILTYTGDNVTNIKWYDTADMNTIKSEVDYEYDTANPPFFNVVTQTYPTIRVNNITHVISRTYGNNPSSKEYFIDINYNNKNLPIEYHEEDDKGNSIYDESITYDNCD